MPTSCSMLYRKWILIRRRHRINADQSPIQLEHLENVFYKQALTMFPESAFLAAGLQRRVLPAIEVCGP